jgi:hypothetical protein
MEKTIWQNIHKQLPLDSLPYTTSPFCKSDIYRRCHESEEIACLSRSRVRASWIYVNNCPTRCNNIQFIFVCKLLYMVRVVSPPIIRSSCHRPVQSRLRKVAVRVLHMPDGVDKVAWAPADGWRYHPKYVEQFTDINKLYIVASCWIIGDIACLIYNQTKLT